MNDYRTITAASTLAFLGCLMAGCAEMQVINPWARQEWAAEEAKYGKTFDARVQEVRTLRAAAASMKPEEREKQAADLVTRLRNEPNAWMRMELARTLGRYKTPAAAEGLRMAMKDDSIDVRVAACEGWGLLGGKEAATQLATMVGSETNIDVRIAATNALANIKDPRAVNALGIALDDRDPALRYRAAQSLASVTGENYGSDFVAWREYIRKQAPAESPATAPGDNREVIASEPSGSFQPY